MYRSMATDTVARFYEMPSGNWDVKVTWRLTELASIEVGAAEPHDRVLEMLGYERTSGWEPRPYGRVCWVVKP